MLAWTLSLPCLGEGCVTLLRAGDHKVLMETMDWDMATTALVSSGLNDQFELSMGIGMAPGWYVAPKAVWLPAVKTKGLEMSARAHLYGNELHEQSSAAHDFAVQLNKNSFSVIPSTPLAIHTPLMPNQSIDVSLPLHTLGPVMKTEPLNKLQVAVKNSSDVFYFSCLIPLNFQVFPD
ncbi:hypothetical protein E2I00_006320 [Balaenoptera physalus]|uniref:Uncharacterized protein n=1 Tax=Balaenoptera physalus TaxID=9770 RepID=A0A643BZA7_BALPH|nr:hypothetical protein E2I00_006320 [Balaenoptera physalus]